MSFAENLKQLRKDKQLSQEELEEIHNAIVSGTATYVLKYSAKTERKWMKVKIIKQPRDV